MTNEIEARFIKVNKDEIRSKLKALGAELVQPERLMRRHVGGSEYREDRWVRLRDEGDKVTLAFKDKSGENAIDVAKEIETTVGDFDAVHRILTELGVPWIGYQESKRESWLLRDVQVEIDTWPGMSPYIEIEADSEQKVKDAAQELGFDWADVRFDYADEFFAEENGITPEEAFLRFDDIRFEQFES